MAKNDAPKPSAAPTEEETAVTEAEAPVTEDTESPVGEEAPVEETAPVDAEEALEGDEGETEEAPLPPVHGSTVETEGSQPTPPAVEAVVETPAPAPGSVQTLQASDLDQHTLDMLRSQVDDYIKGMGKAVPVSRDAGGRYQRQLYQTLERILKLKGTMFNRAWSDLLAKVAAEREGAFHEKRVLRFMDTTKFEKDQIRIFTNLMHLVIHTAQPKGRQQMLKLIDIGSVTKDLPIEGAADKLHAYYLM